MLRLARPRPFVALCLFFAAGCSGVADESAAPGEAPVAQQAWLDLAATSATSPRVEWDQQLGVATEIAGAFPVAATEPARMAFGFLADHAALFGAAAGDLEIASVRESLVGWHVRFRQRAAGLHVHDVEVAVHIDQRGTVPHVFLVRSNLAPALSLRSPQLPKDSATDLAAAWASAAGLASARIEDATEIALRDGSRGWQVDVRSDRPARLVRLVISRDGAILETRELLRRANGTGWVFDPSPVAETGDFTLIDNNNADSPELTAARRQVVLPGLDGTGRLSGPYVDAYNSVNLRAVEPTLVFNYTRSNDLFEEVMAYYHIDAAERRLQAMGFGNVMNWQLKAQVNGKQTDNSWYDSKKQTIMYGAGGVDDAEDADVILHEYGHAVQDDQVPGFGVGAEAGAMGEGFGDFHAVSVHALTPNLKSDGACVAPWDATYYQPPPCLRRTDTQKHFPEFAVNEVHDDGEMWSAALWEAAQTVGPLETLRIAVQAHFLLAPNATFQQASDALLLTDQQIDAGAHAEVLRRLLTWRGLSRTLTPPSTYAGPWESHPAAVASTSPYGNLADEWVDVSHPGAAAIRLHFSSFSTEASYDHVYLYDPQIHLYAIYSGNLGAFNSVVVQGDTVRVRLVSDTNIAGAGHVIDHYDIPAPDAADGGAPDAAQDSGPQGDANPPQDAAGQPDADPPLDSGPPQDAAGQPDADPPVESGPPQDAAGQPDADPPVDSGPSQDAAGQPDADPPAESGPPQDAPTADDSSPEPDAVTPDGPTQDADAAAQPDAAADAWPDAAAEASPADANGNTDGASGLDAAGQDAGDDAAESKDGAPAAGDIAGDSGGCGCRTQPTPTGWAGIPVSLLALAAIRRRRKDHAAH